jgi:putative endopeptidase
VQKYFSEESKEMVEQMVEDLRSAYRDRINGLTWMTDATKQKALEKLDAFTYKIGYPDKWKDYSDLDLNRESYLVNMMTLAKYKSQENLAKLGKPVDRDEWGMGAHIVNAYYNPLNNEVVFPAGILQPPFFDPKADAAINYGAIGGVIGHEFTHGFDDQGSQFDAQGNLNNWWTEEDRVQFEALTGALVAQYDAYEAIPGVFVQGKLTLGENIADLGGLTLAYHAYKKHMEGKDTPEPIDGFTAEQRVFLGWAQVWQSHSRDEQVRNQVMTDPHSPAHFRVVGPMSNMPEFKEAWGCGEGDPMVREEQIVIW